MDNLQAFPIDENTRCLAIQKVKARLIKDTFIREGCIDRQENIAKQVIKYSTLLSEKMLDKIKTEELREFERNVQDYCMQFEKLSEMRREKHEDVKAISVSQFLNDYKHSTKARLQNHKKRTKTSQSSDLSIGPSKQSPVKGHQQNKTEIPLDNQKIKQAISLNKGKVKPAKQFHVNGRGVNSQIINLLQKLDEMESIQKLRKRKDMNNQEQEEYLYGHTNMLKKEQQRLSTAFESQERTSFKPMGRIKKDPRQPNDKNDSKIEEIDHLKKLHNRANRVIQLKPLKKSQIVVSSNYVGKASLHLEQGLPRSIRSKVPNKKTKRSQDFISFNNYQRTVNQKNQNRNRNSENASMVLQQKDMFLLNNFK